VSRRRPQHSREPLFQVMAMFVHLFCAVFNLSAATYHMRRIRIRKESTDETP